MLKLSRFNKPFCVVATIVLFLIGIMVGCTVPVDSKLPVLSEPLEMRTFIEITEVNESFVEYPDFFTDNVHHFTDADGNVVEELFYEFLTNHVGQYQEAYQDVGFLTTDYENLKAPLSDVICFAVVEEDGTHEIKCYKIIGTVIINDREFVVAIPYTG